MRHFRGSMALISAIFAIVEGDMLVPRQDVGNSYVQKVCYPEGTSNPKAPCVSILEIGELCQPNGTSPLALEAHKQCICKGSFFADYTGCQACLEVHGVLSPRNNAHYLSVASGASASLCGSSATPSAAFPAIFSSIDAAATPVTTGATASSDQFPSKTEVSLYYTASGSQGPGAIEGSATAATTRVQPATSSSSPSSSASATAGATQSSRSTTSSSSGTSTGGAVTTSSSSGIGAIPTAAVGGAVMGVAAMGALAAVF